MDTGVVFATGNLASGVILVFRVSNVAKEEFIEAIRSAFDAVKGAIGSTDFTLGEYSAVAR